MRGEKNGMSSFNCPQQRGANGPVLYRMSGPLAEFIAMWTSSCGRAPRAWKIEIFRGLVIPQEEKFIDCGDLACMTRKTIPGD